MSNADLNVARELRQTSIRKYGKHTSQVETKLDWLHDWILVLAIFVKHLRKVYENEELGQNISVSQDIDLE